MEFPIVITHGLNHGRIFSTGYGTHLTAKVTASFTKGGSFNMYATIYRLIHY